MTDVFTPDPALCERILAEYREMPGLRLSLSQAARLWGLDLVQCEATLAALVATGKLGRSSRGLYSTSRDAEWVRQLPARRRRRGAAA